MEIVNGFKKKYYLCRNKKGILESKELIKSMGATFTPRGLAGYVADRILAHDDKKEVVVLDPACGDGELLLAMGERLALKGIDFTLSGYDLNEDYLGIARERIDQLGYCETHFVHGDFLDLVDLNRRQLSFDLFTKSKYANFSLNGFSSTGV